MSVKTLNSAETFVAPSASPRRLTYSIAPSAQLVAPPELHSMPAELESFLEGENPIGCIRGVMWVMAFNAGVFLAGFMLWQSFKYLL